jgi:uncharacterized flavoprotein (TIGR03862 family)
MPHDPAPSYAPTLPRIAIVGAGPAGLMAAETIAAAGVASIDVFDAMPSAGRKFLLAGKGGLNLTHSESLDAFVARYGARRAELAALIERFGPAQLREWARGLGIETFVGSSGRVFPSDMKAAPLLRAWLHRLRLAGVRFHMRHRWLGWAGDPREQRTLRFATPAGEIAFACDAVVLALGGASWARLGSDGAWVPHLVAAGAEVAALQPSNCGFDVAGGWSEHVRSRHAGAPLKNVALTLDRGDDGTPLAQAGEFVVTERGIEGSLVYAMSGAIRDRIARDGAVTVHLDLLPSLDAARVAAEVARPRGSRSLATHLKSRLGLTGVKAALLYERLPREVIADPHALAEAIKAVPLTLSAARPVDEAISTAGGVRFDSLRDDLMLAACPGVFCAGEMLDWEAPTGGYLLTACFATGVAAGRGVVRRTFPTPISAETVSHEAPSAS